MCYQPFILCRTNDMLIHQNATSDPLCFLFTDINLGNIMALKIEIDIYHQYRPLNFYNQISSDCASFITSRFDIHEIKIALCVAIIGENII